MEQMERCVDKATLPPSLVNGVERGHKLREVDEAPGDSEGRCGCQSMLEIIATNKTSRTWLFSSTANTVVTVTRGEKAVSFSIEVIEFLNTSSML